MLKDQYTKTKVLLLINDSRENDYFKNLLQEKGYRVLEADSRKQAREIAAISYPHPVLIIDSLVSDKDRDTYLNRPSSVWLLMLVEHQENQIISALSCEPDDLLYRPLNRAEILFRIKKITENNLSSKNNMELSGTAQKVEPENKYTTIMVVEDNKLEQKRINDFLKALNYNVLSAFDGQEAYQRINEYSPDLILLDLVIPGKDGIELLQEIRKKKELLEIPVIIISGLSDTKNKLKALEIGADDYIQKPVDLDELKARMRSVLRKKFRFEKITQNYQLAVERAITDSLTGLYNHGYFFEFVNQEINRCRRYRHPLTLVLGDIDYFKIYNDTHGHPQGDTVLKTVGKIIKQNTRIVDLAVRYGGEEFAVVLTETDLKGGLIVAEKLRYLIEKHPFPGQETQPGQNLTISLGVSSISPDDKETSFPDLIKKADQALYLAKDRGRNQVSFLY